MLISFALYLRKPEWVHTRLVVDGSISTWLRHFLASGVVDFGRRHLKLITLITLMPPTITETFARGYNFAWSIQRIMVLTEAFCGKTQRALKYGMSI